MTGNIGMRATKARGANPSTNRGFGKAPVKRKEERARRARSTPTSWNREPQPLVGASSLIDWLGEPFFTLLPK
jgi:hypothetical protein